MEKGFIDVLIGIYRGGMGFYRGAIANHTEGDIILSGGVTRKRVILYNDRIQEEYW